MATTSSTSDIGTSEASEVEPENSFNHQQRSSLEDYISVSIVLQYNRK